MGEILTLLGVGAAIGFVLGFYFGYRFGRWWSGK